MKSILGQLAWGLGAVHRHGIVHRDLKPENVLLTLSEEGGEQVRLLDFGVARLAPVGGTAGLTADGLIVGTPAYIAPEQALGEPTDERTDLYALGCIAYELLTGSRPFPGPGPEQFIDQHINEPPPPLLEIAPRSPLTRRWWPW